MRVYHSVNRTLVIAAVSFSIGLVFLGMAMLLDSSRIEGFFLGSATGELAWGPNLFRTLLGLHGVVLMLNGTLILRLRRAPAPSPQPVAPDDAALETRMKPPTARAWIIVALLCTIALGLRLWRLNTGLWLDEILTLVDYVRQPMGKILTTFSDQNQHMLYSMLAHVSVNVFGESAWSLRVPAVLFGLSGIVALFLLGRRVTNTTESLLACGLLTVSYHHIWFSQNARGYTGLLLFAILATWAWLTALPQRNTCAWIAYVVAVTLGMWTHTTMAFVVLGHTLSYLWLLIRARTAQQPSAKRLGSQWVPLVALFLSTTLTFQLYALALPDFLRSALHEVSKESEWTNVRWLIMETVRGLQLGFQGSAVLIAGLVLLALGWHSLYRRNSVAAIVMILPGPLLCLTMILLGHNLWPRFLFFSMGFALLFAVRGTMKLAKILLSVLSRTMPTAPRVALVGAAMWAVVITASLVKLPKCYALPKQDFVGAREYVNTQRNPADAVVAVGLAALAYERYYAPKWLVANTRIELETLRRKHTDVWLIYTMPTHVKKYHPELWQSIQRHFKEVQVFPGTMYGGEVRVCRQRVASRGSAT